LQGALVEAEQHLVHQSADGAQQLGVEAEPGSQLEGERQRPLTPCRRRSKPPVVTRTILG
jgi:hypothetical protein